MRGNQCKTPSVQVEENIMYLQMETVRRSKGPSKIVWHLVGNQRAHGGRIDQTHTDIHLVNTYMQTDIAHVHAYKQTNKQENKQTYADKHSCMHTYMHTYVHKCIHASHTYIQTYTHVRKHTHTHCNRYVFADTRLNQIHPSVFSSPPTRHYVLAHYVCHKICTHILVCISLTPPLRRCP